MIDAREAIRKTALGFLGYSGLAALARPLVGGIGAILMLHRVTAAPGHPLGFNRQLSITPDFLDELIADMKGRGYRFVTMDEAVGRLQAGAPWEKFATITADDGYRDNLTEALPVLERHDAPMTVYIAPGLIDGEPPAWWDVLADCVAAADELTLASSGGTLSVSSATPALKRAAFAGLQEYLTDVVREEEQRDALRDLARQAGVDPDHAGRDLLMDWHEVRRMAAHPLITVGAHTIDHYCLKRLSPGEAFRQIAEAGKILGEKLGAVPRHMAYPYGHPGAAGRREADLAARAGYVSAVTTRHGLLRPEHVSALHALPRVSVDGRFQNLAYLRPMLSGVTTLLANGGRLLVTV